MKYLALYINCTFGHFKPYGPFDSAEEAEKWIEKQQSQHLYDVMPIQAPGNIAV